MRIIICSMLLTMILALPAAAADESGGQAGSFLAYGIGARAIALGGGLGAVTDDAAALFWNPAGLAALESNQVTAAYGLIREDRAQSFLAYAHCFEALSVAAGWLHYGIDKIQHRDSDGEYLGDFTDSENVFLVALGADILSKTSLTLRLGAGFRYFQHDLFDYRSTGVGGDLGARLRLAGHGPLDHLLFGISIHDLGATMKWDTVSAHEDRVPTTIRMGVAAGFRDWPVLLLCETTKVENIDARLHGGAEVVIRQLILRLGLDDGNVTAGVGVPIKAGATNLILDYGYREDEITSAMLHFFSVGLLF
jgi:hypothetical protein